MSTYPLRFGKYLLLERVNVGGMAEVFKAKPAGLSGHERVLAIKRILPSLVEDDEFVRMFIDEARIAVQLNHQNIIQIYELGKHGEDYYIAMEYLPSRDLRAILDRMRAHGQLMPTAQAAYITRKVCEGLDYAHKKRDASGAPMNIIHRDVSPQNILVSFDGEVKVIDFGIAKAANRSSKTQAGVLKGKFGYMSPEQVRGLPTDRRSDIFAVGVLLYEMLTGERLFIGESDFSTLERVRNAEVVPPSQFNKKISWQLEQAVLRALARDVEDRYQWAGELAADLEVFTFEDKQPYGSRRLAEVMKDAYVAEIALERQRNEAHLRLGAEDALVGRGAAYAQSSFLQLQRPKTDLAEERLDAARALRPATFDAEDDEADAPEGGDKTFVIEASAAGLALQRDATEAVQHDYAAVRAALLEVPVPRLRAGSPHNIESAGATRLPAASTRHGHDEDDEGAESAVPQEDDDAATLVGSANPFDELRGGGDQRDLTGNDDDDDEIDASELDDGPPQSIRYPSSARQHPMLDADAPTLAAPAARVNVGPAPVPALEAGQEQLETMTTLPAAETHAYPGVQTAPPSFEDAAGDEDALARELLRGTTGGRADGRNDGHAESALAAAVDGREPTPPPWDSTQSGQPEGHTRPEGDLELAGNEPVAVAASVPPHLVHLLVAAAVVSVTFFLIVMVMLVAKVVGEPTSSVELYAIGDQPPAQDVGVFIDGARVAGLGEPFTVVGEATVRVQGSGMTPVVRLVRATGSSMRQPVLIGGTAPGHRNNDSVTTPSPAPASEQPVAVERAAVGGAVQRGPEARHRPWRLSLATVDDASGKPLRDADVLVGGQLVGRTPLEVELDIPVERVTLRLRKDGYVTREVPLAREGRDTVGPATVRLSPAGSGAAAEPQPKPTPAESDGQRADIRKGGDSVAAGSPRSAGSSEPVSPQDSATRFNEKQPVKQPEKPPAAEKQPARQAEKPPARQAEKQSAPTASASLQIATRPAAEAWIDGRSVGTTPFYSDKAPRLAVGRRRIEFLVKSTGKRHRYEVVLTGSSADNKLVIDFGKAEQPRVTGQVTARYLP